MRNCWAHFRATQFLQPSSLQKKNILPVEGTQLKLTGKEQLRLCLLPVPYTRLLCWLFLKGCRGTGPRFSIRGSGGAWGGWITSLEMEKQSHFKCQAPKLVGVRMFSSHPRGDLCPLKNPLWSLGLLCCSSRWPLLVPIWSTGSSCPQREIISIFSSWATKSGFIVCTLMSSHSLPTFSQELSVPSCSQMREGKKPLWSGEAEPGESSRTEVFQEGLNRAKSPSPWAKPFHSPSSSLAGCGFPDAKCSKCFGQDPSVGVPKGCSIHRVGSVGVWSVLCHFAFRFVL